MKGRIQILGLIGLSVLVLLIVGAPGAKPLPDIQLKATFEPFLQSTITGEQLSCNMLNDIPAPYVSTSDKRYANVVKIAAPSTAGNFYLTLYKNNSAGRFIRLEFDDGELQVPENPLYCASNVYFLGENDKVLDGPEANIFRFKTLYRYSETIIDGKRFLTNTKTPFNFASMKKGEAGIVATVFDFYVEDDPSTDYDESEDWYSLSYQYPARVLCDDIDSDGKLEWVMTPVQEPFYDTNEGDKFYPFDSVIRGLYSNYYMHCLHGYFMLPFKLTLDPK